MGVLDLVEAGTRVLFLLESVLDDPEGIDFDLDRLELDCSGLRFS